MSFIKDNASNWFVLLSALFATSCCIVPTAYVLFGVSLASFGFLSVLEPYRPVFLGIAYIAIGFSFHKFFLKKPDCGCKDPELVNKFGRIATLVSLLLLVIATFFPQIVESIFN